VKDLVGKLKAAGAAACAASAAAYMFVSSAVAQAAGGTIGGRSTRMAQEFSTAGGTASSTAMYVGALVCFVAGVWGGGSVFRNAFSLRAPLAHTSDCPGKVAGRPLVAGEGTGRGGGR